MGPQLLPFVHGAVLGCGPAANSNACRPLAAHRPSRSVVISAHMRVHINTLKLFSIAVQAVQEPGWELRTDTLPW